LEYVVPAGHWQGRCTAEQGGSGVGAATAAIAKAEARKSWESIILW